MMKLTYPNEAPVWLKKWPKIEEINVQYKDGIKLFYFRQKNRLRISSVLWNEIGLRMHIEAHWASWSYKNASWEKKCSCGHPNATCTHTFAVAVIANGIFISEKWIVGNTAATAIVSSLGGKSTLRSNAKLFQRIDAEKKYQPSLFDGFEKKVGISREIEVEVDYKTAPGFVLIRIYKTDNGKRMLCKMRSVYHLWFTSKVGNKSVLNKNDIDFLAWFVAKYGSRKLLDRGEITAKKLTKSEFDNWLNVWIEEQPKRFIDRDSQKIIQKGNRDCPIHFELQLEGEKTRICAYVTSPLKRKIPFYELAADLRNSPSKELLIDNVISELKYPISTKTFWEIFAIKNPTISSNMVVDNIAVLLENRLDLIYGPAVRRIVKESPLEITISQENAFFIIALSSNKKPVFAQTATAPGSIRFKNNIFIIHLYEINDIDFIKTLIKQFSEVKSSNNIYKIPATKDNAQILLEKWQEIPKKIKTHVNSNLTLLREKMLTPQIACNGDKTWVNFELLWKIEDTSFSTNEIKHAIAEKRTIIQTRKGDWFNFSAERVTETLAFIENAGIMFDFQRVMIHEAKEIIEKFDEDTDILYSSSSENFIRTIRAIPKPSDYHLPKILEKTLRVYQKEGVDFLWRCASFSVSPILADDMGLGKTIQTLAFIKAKIENINASQSKRPFLVVCPASVISVWVAEAKKFTPALKTLIYRGNPDIRVELLKKIKNYDIIVTNYAMVRNDNFNLRKIEFECITLDEAQNIRNPQSQVAITVKKLQSKHKIALTGTPLENKLMDLWSIMDFLNPGYLGDQHAFKERYMEHSRNLSSSDIERFSLQVSPLMLRRTKALVAPELPPKTEEIIKVELSEAERSLYDKYLMNIKKELKGKGMIEILAILTRLRQISCHTSLIPNKVFETAMMPPFAQSAKLKRLLEMLDTLIEEKHSILIFSQFTSILDLIALDLDEEEIPYFMITGKTPTDKRAELVDDFNTSKNASVFLLSLKAAGTGLTLTRADYVFIFDPWWNPAVERQAIDRTHRIGQDKPVIAYKLIAENTIEDSILKLQKEKQDLFDSVVEGSLSKPSWLSSEDLIKLIG